MVRPCCVHVYKVCWQCQIQEDDGGAHFNRLGRGEREVGPEPPQCCERGSLLPQDAQSEPVVSPSVLNAF